MAGRFEISVLNVHEPGAVQRVVALLNETLDGAEYTRESFSWKHRDNPQGKSIIAAAFDVETNRLAAVRVFWRMDLRDGERSIVAYQPCDTATHRDFRRRGLFRQLSAVALDEARRHGAEIIFNFPNRQSKPGNLSLGWSDIGGLSILFRPVHIWRFGYGALRTRGQPKQFVELNVEPVVGSPDWEEWADRARWPDGLLRGARSPAFLAWRFGEHPLHRYHLIPHASGAVIGRLGRRGGLNEFRVVSWLGDAALDVTAARRCLREVRETLGPDLVTTLLHRHHPLYPRLQLRGFLPLRGRPNFVVNLLNDSVSLDRARWAIEGTEKDTW